MNLRTFLVMAAVLLFLYAMFTVGFPFLLALVVALMLEPLNRLLMRFLRFNRLAATTFTSTVFTLLMLGFFFLIGLKVFTELMAFLRNLPAFLRETGSTIQRKLLEQSELIVERFGLGDEEQIQEFISQATVALQESLLSLANVVSSQLFNVAGILSNLFIFFLVFTVAVFLFNLSLPLIKSSFLSLFEENSRDKVDQVLQELGKSIFGFFKAQVILSGLTYIVSFAGLLILDVGYPMVIALMIVIVDLLPILGTGSFIVPWAIFEIAMGNISLAIGLFVLFILLTVFRRIIEPKVVGDSVGIGALPALISLYVGFKLFGVIGFFLGPIIVIVFQAMRKVGLLHLKIKLLE